MPLLPCVVVFRIQLMHRADDCVERGADSKEGTEQDSGRLPARHIVEAEPESDADEDGRDEFGGHSIDDIEPTGRLFDGFDFRRLGVFARGIDTAAKVVEPFVIVGGIVGSQWVGSPPELCAGYPSRKPGGPYGRGPNWSRNCCACEARKPVKFGASGGDLRA